MHTSALDRKVHTNNTVMMCVLTGSLPSITSSHSFMSPWLIACMKYFLVMFSALRRDDIERCYAMCKISHSTVMHTHTHVHTHTLTPMHAHTHTLTPMHARTHARTRTHTHTHILLQTYMHKAYLFTNISTSIQNLLSTSSVLHLTHCLTW